MYVAGVARVARLADINGCIAVRVTKCIQASGADSGKALTALAVGKKQCPLALVALHGILAHDHGAAGVIHHEGPAAARQFLGDTVTAGIVAIKIRIFVNIRAAYHRFVCNRRR